MFVAFLFIYENAAQNEIIGNRIIVAKIQKPSKNCEAADLTE